MVWLDSLAPPTSLLRYEALTSRKQLSSEDERRYSQLQKGFAGEKRLETTLQSQQSRNIIPLFNNLFESLDREFEIDCLLLTTDTVFLLEVKNYTGNYSVENGNIIHLPSKRQIYNPVTQLDRTEFLFKRMLSDMQINMQVRSFVMFVNYNFVLYEASLQLPIIFPSQIKSFLEKTDRNARALSTDIKRLAKMLIRTRKDSSTYERLPPYNMEELKKGVFCEYCSFVLVRSNHKTFMCSNCRRTVSAKDAVLHAIAQYHLLFPEEKITTNKIAKWCGNSITNNYIREILAKYFKVHSAGRNTYYLYHGKRSHLEALYNKHKTL